MPGESFFQDLPLASKSVSVSLKSFCAGNVGWVYIGVSTESTSPLEGWTDKLGESLRKCSMLSEQPKR